MKMANIKSVRLMRNRTHTAFYQMGLTVNAKKTVVLRLPEMKTHLARRSRM